MRPCPLSGKEEYCVQLENQKFHFDFCRVL